MSATEGSGKWVQTAADRWWENVFFGLHYDLHANANDTELGAELTHEHLREQREARSV